MSVQLKQIDVQVKRKSIPVIKRIKSVQDACDELGLVLSDELPYKSPKNKDEETANSFRKLMIVCDALLEGNTLDWDNTNQKKHYPYFDMRGAFSFRVVFYDYYFTSAAARLCVDTEAKARHFGMWFLAEFKSFHGK